MLKPEAGRSNWIDNVYQRDDNQDDARPLTSLHGDDAAEDSRYGTTSWAITGLHM